jgi:Protein of unknown function (DUF1698)
MREGFAVPFTRKRRRAESVEPVAPASTQAQILDAYVADPPSPQLAIDIFAGDWSSELPAHLGVEAGSARLFADDRIRWLLEEVGDLSGREVLELGPLEGGHTFQLSRAGAHVTAIEGNTRAFLKCLVAKELLGMTSCRFLLGDFVRYLEAHQDEQFDLVLASGVLYHSTDPLHLLELIAGVTDRIALWTHYYDPAVVQGTPTVNHHFVHEPATAEFRGRRLRLHRRDYLEALEWTGFCGGPDAHALWLERGDLLAVLDLLGFSDVRVGSDDPTHVNGPCLLLHAARPAAGG